MGKFNIVQQTSNAGTYKEFKDKYDNDTSTVKVNLIYGLYRSEEGSVYLLPTVKRAQKMVLEETQDHCYLTLSGNGDYSKLASKLILGDIEKQSNDGTIISVQSVGGTGALRLGAVFLSRHIKCTTAYYSDPSWEDHGSLLAESGFQNVHKYRYFNKNNNSIDFEGFCEDISNAPSSSVIILHACCHNPTGLDLNKEQWKIIAKILKERELIPFFDVAYQGFATGDIKEDVWAIRYFLSEGFEFLCAHSFSKIFTMYNERTGNLTLVLKSATNVESIKIHFDKIIRYMYSNPPNHGARVVQKILADSKLYHEWSENIKTMVARMKDIRASFRKALEESAAPGNWDHVTNQTGMFIYSPFTISQLEYLRNVYHVYIVNPGRINLTGLNKNSTKYVAEAISEALKRKTNTNKNIL